MKLHVVNRGGYALRQAEAGFTLVEMLVVIAIIGLIMGLVGPRVLNYLGNSKVKAAKLQIESFSSSLDLFYLDVGRYPTVGEGLSALARKTRQYNDLERTLSQDRRRADRSVGTRLSLPLAWRARSLRDRVVGIGWPGGRGRGLQPTSAMTPRPIDHEQLLRLSHWRSL